MEKEIEKDYWDDWDSGGSDEDLDSSFLTRRKDKPLSGAVNKSRSLTTDD